MARGTELDRARGAGLIQAGFTVVGGVELGLSVGRQKQREEGMVLVKAGMRSLVDEEI